MPAAYTMEILLKLLVNAANANGASLRKQMLPVVVWMLLFFGK